MFENNEIMQRFILEALLGGTPASGAPASPASDAPPMTHRLTPRTLTPSPTPVKFNRTCKECGHSKPGKKKIIINEKFNAETGKLEKCTREVYCMPLCIPENLRCYVLDQQDECFRKLRDKIETLQKHCKRQGTELENLQNKLQRMTDTVVTDAAKCVQIFDECNDKMRKQNTKLKGSACEQCATTISKIRKFDCLRHENVAHVYVPLDGYYYGIEYGESHPIELMEDETVKFCVVCRGLDSFVNEVEAHDPIMMHTPDMTELSTPFAKQPIAVQTGGSKKSN